eukprot:1114245-Karenia_brevis.AAC.1
MPVPGHDFRSTLRVQAKYSDLMRSTRAILACMRKPVELEPGVEHLGNGMRFRLSNERLIPPEFNCCWTEHSERAVLNTWAAM